LDVSFKVSNQQELRREENVFVELMPLLKERTLLITVARVDEKVKVDVIPAKVKEGEEHALTTPLSFTGSAEELDSELGRHLASYVDSHLALGSSLAEAQAELDAAAKAARQKVKTTHRARSPIRPSRRSTRHQGRPHPQPIRRRVCSLRSRLQNRRRR
jgi:PRTRC genetic system protein E